MTQLSGMAEALARAAHALLRIGAALLFLQHGLRKMFGLAGGYGGTPGATAPLTSLMGVAGILETLGGVLLVLGLWTRPVAFLVMGEMLTAFLIAHLPRGGWPLQNGGELPLLYALVFAFLAAAGPGPASVDSLQRRPARRS
jgi:putative oxidoreductase